MNAVGVIGDFLVDNQLLVEAALLFLLAVIVAWWIIKQLVQKPKQDAKINELLTKIDSLENKLDGIELSNIAEETDSSAVIDKPDTAKSITNKTAPTGEDAVIDEKAELMKRILEEDEAMDKEEVNPNLEETIELKDLVIDVPTDSAFAKPASKFASRDWGEDRHGNVYTEDMLKDLIN